VLVLVGGRGALHNTENVVRCQLHFPLQEGLMLSAEFASEFAPEVPSATSENSIHETARPSLERRRTEHNGSDPRLCADCAVET
jgi:hypothetical protein